MDSGAGGVIVVTGGGMVLECLSGGMAMTETL